MMKKEINNEKLACAVSRLRALAHPMSLAIIKMLEEEKKMNVSSIFKRLQLEQAATSYHLTRLKRKGILGSNRVGKQTFYFVKDDSLQTIINCIESVGISEQ